MNEVIEIDRSVFKTQEEIASMYNVSIPAVSKAFKLAKKKGRKVNEIRVPAKAFYDIRTIPKFESKNDTTT